MDYVKEALIKAKAATGQVATPSQKVLPSLAIEPRRDAQSLGPNFNQWTPRSVRLNAKLMKRNRIVSFAMSDPSHVAFDLLRTRVRKTLADNHWRTIAITSPSPGCGKTMVGLNLALTLARVPDCKVVLVDLDLKRPSIARTLGVAPLASIGQFLQGKAEAKDCFAQVDTNLVVGLSNDNIRNSSELIQAPPMADLLKFIQLSLAPDIVLFDLPPMRSSDDALAFLPQVDAALLVVAAGTTTVTDVDECEELISREKKMLGVVLNKSSTAEKLEYY